MRSGRPRTVLAEENIIRVSEVLAQDREVPFDMQDNTGRGNQLNIPQSGEGAGPALLQVFKKLPEKCHLLLVI